MEEVHSSLWYWNHNQTRHLTIGRCELIVTSRISQPSCQFQPLLRYGTIVVAARKLHHYFNYNRSRIGISCSSYSSNDQIGLRSKNRLSRLPFPPFFSFSPSLFSCSLHRMILPYLHLTVKGYKNGQNIVVVVTLRKRADDIFAEDKLRSTILYIK